MKNNLILFAEIFTLISTLFLLFYFDNTIIQIIMVMCSLFIILKWVIAFRLIYNKINKKSQSYISQNKWHKITSVTKFYDNEILRLVKRDQEYFYKYVGGATSPGYIQLLEIDELYENGSYFIKGTPCIFDIKKSSLLKDGFEILKDDLRDTNTWPRTLDDAVKILEAEFGEKEIEKIKNLNYEEFEFQYLDLGQYIRNRFGLWAGNKDLITNIGCKSKSPDDISEIIIKEFYNYIINK
ncbi:MAG: hypothetical protein L0Y79_04325 [Chlorobi bacterium]|nr:hypothetical protein [Chlorobiota bacterium]MCI0717145.1 hypothetical protein [Chlorobiota bacterium]